ncbi:hypothetical protein BV925_21905 [Pectobacterium odoriferum]|nr:hypothetical protein BV925_21905 [Pectobacterium odoriferum]
MAKQKVKINNWAAYNKALFNRGSLIFWLDDSAIQAWYDEPKTSSRGRPQRYSELAISTVLMLTSASFASRCAPLRDSLTQSLR